VNIRASLLTFSIILSLPCGEQKRENACRVKYWEIIAANLKKAGWSLGCISAVNSNERTIWIADAHRDDGRRFVVRADEKLTAFVELKSAHRTGQRLAASPFALAAPCLDAFDLIRGVECENADLSFLCDH
jgi:hypothetical protein